MPRTSAEAEITARYATQKPKRPPPPGLTQEQESYWIRILGDLPPDHIRSDAEPILIELCRHLGYSTQIAEQLAAMRTVSLAGTGWDDDGQRSLFTSLLDEAREQARLIASLSTKLRLTPQAQTVARDVARERARRVSGPKPWEFGVIAGGASDDDDDNGAGPATN